MLFLSAIPLRLEAGFFVQALPIVVKTMLPSTPLNPTFKLLALLSKDNLTPDELTIIRNLLSKTPNFKQLREGIDQHATWGFIYHNLVKYQLTVAADLFDYLRLTSRQVAMANMQLADETHKLCHFLSEKNISVIVLKGIPLAQQLYSDIGKRHSSDIDLLVPHAQLPAARICLEESGYQDMDHIYMGSANKQWIENHIHHSIYRNAKGIWLELHWRLLSNRQVMPLSDQYGSEAIARSDGDHSYAVLPDRDLLLFLCWHGSKHIWEQLKWLSDIAVLIENYQWDWQALINSSNHSQSLRPLLLGVLLSHYVFATELPEPIARELKGHPIVGQLASFVIDNSFNNTQAWYNRNQTKRQRLAIHLKQTFFNMQLSGSLLYKLHILDCSLMPSNSDFEWVKLPASLFYCYYLIRPVRILYDQLQQSITSFIPK